MKKIITIALIFVVVFMFNIGLSGCNRQIVDTVYRYNYAIIQLPNGEIIEGALESWRDYDDSDQLQVKIDGVYYLVHSTDCVLMAK